MKNYVTSIKELAKELNVSTKEATQLVLKNNSRLNKKLNANINNPSKRWYGTNSPSKYSYSTNEILSNLKS